MSSHLSSDRRKFVAPAMCDLPRDIMLGPRLNEIKEEVTEKDEEKDVPKEEPSSHWMPVRWCSRRCLLFESSY